MRKTSLQNKTIHQQLKLLTLSGRAQYSKPQTNSFRSNLVIRNTSSIMNEMEIELNGADQTASTEANATDAANNDDTEEVMYGKEDGDTSEEDSLIDFNDVETVEAAEKTAAQKALKEMLTNNGFTLRNILRSEKVKGHFTSPFSKEDEMSLEDILSEIPIEDLHKVGMVQRRIYMPASFVQKWVIPTIRARNALKDHGTRLPGGFETAMLFSIFDQSILDLTKPRPQHDEGAYALRSIVACAQDANIKLIEQMRKGNNGLKEIARASLKQLEQVVQLPPHEDLWKMSAIDYFYYQDRIADAINQYRGHTERDLEDLQLLREQIEFHTRSFVAYDFVYFILPRSVYLVEKREGY